MDLDKLFSITEKLRIQAIGDPVWIPEKKVFEYSNQSINVVVVLKAIRAAQGIKSLYLLCRNGLFIDMGAIYRCVSDCSEEIYFLLEQYPIASDNVKKFVKAFFETTIDGHLNAKTEHVPTGKIHSAMVRTLTGSKQDEKIRTSINNIHKTFSGYTHANYSHIMQAYGGTPSNFNLSGVSSVQQREMHMQLVEQAYYSVLCSIGFAANKFGLAELFREVVQCCE
ncbi:MAG: hypothetical protein NG740_00920 [Omnitrophica bacterium]|nr:hypothetical protein [Candidatus Omnitrophota bacterium]